MSDMGPVTQLIVLRGAIYQLLEASITHLHGTMMQRNSD